MSIILPNLNHSFISPVPVPVPDSGFRFRFRIRISGFSIRSFRRAYETANDSDF